MIHLGHHPSSSPARSSPSLLSVARLQHHSSLSSLVSTAIISSRSQMTNSVALSPAFSPAVLPPSATSAYKSPIISQSLSLFSSQSRIKRPRSIKTISCNTAVKSADLSSEEEMEADAKAKVGCRVKVTAPLKVYHVNHVPEVDLEGKLKDYVAVWKGKGISANLPYKVDFCKEVEGRGRGNVKFVAHLKDDEFELI
ncbi:unnamed protein product [Eruca vesicaria subsp. sativa]|uniref:Ferredoxin thioredoxin reductase alpha chain domain-containing protein n=1 Tax=Eruca vesicaria subsp. sativa TaxID=29727 RepID=A0ABC8LI01_ERUVS|nr:unnamed protein product [Eruca vesicaria subsp. sativa]